MIDKRARNRLRQLDSVLTDQLRKNFRVVIDFKIAAEIGVILLDAVIAVRTDGDDLLHAVAVHDVDIGLGQRLEEILVAGTHRGIAAAAFFRSQNAEADAGFLENFRESNRDFLAAVVKRTGAAHVEQVLDIGILGQRLDADFLGPVAAQVRADAPGIGVVFHVAAGQLQFRSKIRFGQNLVAAHVDNLGHMLNRRRAVLHTVHAVGAGPQFVQVDHFADQRFSGGFFRGGFAFRGRGRSGKLGRLREDRFLQRSRHFRDHHRERGIRTLFQPEGFQILRQLLRRQRLAGQIGRAAVLAASAARAGVGIKNLLPGELFQLADAERFGVFKVADRLDVTGRFARTEEMVGRGRDDVEQSGIGNVGDEAQAQNGVHPPGDLMKGAGGAVFDARKGVGQQPSGKGPVFPGRIGHVNAQRFGDKSGKDDGADEQKHDHVIRCVVHLAFVAQTVRSFHKAAIQRHDHADQNSHPEEIHQEGKD